VTIQPWEVVLRSYIRAAHETAGAARIRLSLRPLP
jgi:hypothetical protein